MPTGSILNIQAVVSEHQVIFASIRKKKGYSTNKNPLITCTGFMSIG